MKHDLPLIGEISTIYIINANNVVFRVIPFSSIYLQHFRVYVLHHIPNEKEQIIYLSSLAVQVPVHIRTPQALPQKKVVILPHFIH